MSDVGWIADKIVEKYEFLDFDQPKGRKELDNK